MSIQALPRRLSLDFRDVFDAGFDFDEATGTFEMKNGTAHDIADQARREGVQDLRQAGLRKVKAGLTSLEEVEAVTNE